MNAAPDPANLRTCGRCGAMAHAIVRHEIVAVGVVPFMASSMWFQCSGCKRRFNIPSKFLLALQGVGIALCAALCAAMLLAVGVEAWPVTLVFVALAAVMGTILGLGVRAHRRNPIVEPENQRLLAQAFADPVLGKFLRGQSSLDDLIKASQKPKD